MIRLKLFFLFIGFALLSLIKPRQVIEMLDCAEEGHKARLDKQVIDRMNKLVQRNDTQQERVDRAIGMGTKITRSKIPL